MVNITDVAKKANVSKTSISRFLNGKPYVSSKTRAKIIKAIKELSYRPSAVAISLAKRKTNTIGFIVDDITNPTAAELLKIIVDLTYDMDYKIILVNKKLEDTTWKYIESLLDSRVDGIISTSVFLSDRYLKRLEKMNFPFVFLGSSISSSKIDQVTNDDFKGAYMIVDYLIKLGHKKIAHMTGGPMGREVTKNRHSGYRAALKDSGIKIKEEYIIEGNYTLEGGYKATEKLISLKDRPTAIFCSNDYAAYGAIDAILKNNLKVPGDISVVGYDDLKISSNELINLTTVILPKHEMAKKTIEILMNKIRNKKDEKIHKIILEPKLIIRKTARKLLD